MSAVPAIQGIQGPTGGVTGLLTTSFNMQFAGGNNIMGFGLSTIINNNGCITLRFPFNGKQIYIPVFTTGMFTSTYLLPIGYRPPNMVTFTVPVIACTLDGSNNPNGYNDSFIMTIQITNGGVIYFTLFHNFGGNGQLSVHNFIAGTPYMINSCYWGNPYNGDFVCTYLQNQ